MAVPAGTGKAWSDRAVRETRPAEAWSANMGKARAAHSADMHPAEATGVHAAAEMPTTAEMPAAAESAMTATAATSGKHR